MKKYRLRGTINLTTDIAESDIPMWEEASEEKKNSFLEDMKLQLFNLNKHEVAQSGTIDIAVWMEEEETHDNDSDE